jgi:hypothetical protein
MQWYIDNNKTHLRLQKKNDENMGTMIPQEGKERRLKGLKGAK